MEVKKFNVEGMSCTNCALRVEKFVKKMKGVDDVTVNFATKSATIRYDSNKNIDDEIIAIIGKLGYQASVKVNNTEFTEKNNSNDKKKILLLSLLSLIVVYLAMGEMIGLPKIVSSDIISAILQFILVSSVLILCRNIFIDGIKALLSRVPNMNSLVAVGSGVAYVYSVVLTINILIGHLHYVHNLYYESVAVILTLITVGKFLEEKSKDRTSLAFKKLLELRPKTALILKDDVEREISTDTLLKGDVVVVKSGSSIPADGTILLGNAEIDESMLTGESIAVTKAKGDKVVAGTIVVNGYIQFLVDEVGEETVLAKIIDIIENTQNTKGKLARIADKISGVFVQAIMLIAILAGLYWYFIAGKDIKFVMDIVVAVLVVACPCALGLATPVAIMVGSGRGAENGILIKNGEVLEIVSKATKIILDKTGTITEGKPQVDEVQLINIDSNKLANYVYNIEKKSEHPLAKSLVEYVKKYNVNEQLVTDYQNIVGYGLVAKINDETILIGNERLMAKYNVALKENKSVGTKVYVAIEGELSAIFIINDKIRNDSKEAIAKFKKLGLDVVMLTGDNEEVAKSVAKKVGVTEVVSEVLPQEKLDVVTKLGQNDTVIMVGDGVNDAPALTKADIGIAIGAGTDIAMESSDIVLVNNSLLDVVQAINLSKKTQKNIKENLFWAFIYNVVCLPLAIGMFYNYNGLLLNPMIAGFAMSISSLSVVLNALRLKIISIE